MGGKSCKYGFPLSKDELGGWDTSGESDRVQLLICEYKVRHYDQVQLVLLSTKDKLLLHQDNHAKKGTPWGGRLDPAKKGQSQVSMDDIVGRNKLGQIWMRVQQSLVLEQDSHRTDVLEYQGGSGTDDRDVGDASQSRKKVKLS